MYSFIEFAEIFYDNLDHPLAVANAFEELSDAWVVGLFHDILEDTDVGRDLLFNYLAINNKYNTFAEIEKLTRRKGETYFEYIRRLDGIAKDVKIADLKHNLSRTDTLTDSLKDRYNKALKLLTTCKEEW